MAFCSPCLPVGWHVSRGAGDRPLCVCPPVDTRPTHFSQQPWASWTEERPYGRRAEHVEAQAFQGQEPGLEGVTGAGAFESLTDPSHMHNLQRETLEIKPKL